MSIIHGTTAIDYAEARGLALGKHNDPTEEARTGLTVAEAREIAREDPGLIYCDTAQNTEAGVPDGGTPDVDQDWEAGLTIARFEDGSRIVFQESEVEVMTAADWVARQLKDDGQVYEAEDGRDLEDLSREVGVIIEGVRWDGEDDDPYTVMRHEITTADTIRYGFGDGSAIVDSGAGWDLEGPTLGSWMGE